MHWVHDEHERHEQAKWHKAFRELTALRPVRYNSYNYRQLSSLSMLFGHPSHSIISISSSDLSEGCVVLTHRNSTNWAKRRASEHPISLFL